MTSKFNITNIWKNIQELDPRPIRETAQQEVQFAIVGKPGSGRQDLANQLQSDPNRSEAASPASILILDLENAAKANQADLIVMMIDARVEESKQENILLAKWKANRKPVIVFYNHIDLLPEPEALVPWVESGTTPVIYGPASSWQELSEDLAPKILELLPDQEIALGRQYPLLREMAARSLINDTSLTNAVYSLGTGIVEIVPILDAPLNVADMVVLTKAQALLVYKVGLTLGQSTDWQYYVAEFGSVIGGGFLWRQLARSMVGLIPVWGIVPKVAVAYSGTYVVGHAVLHWYLTGKHITREKLAEIRQSAFEQGKFLAKNLLSKVPRPRLRRQEPKALPIEIEIESQEDDRAPCSECGVDNEPDAVYCKSCGKSISD